MKFKIIIFIFTLWIAVGYLVGCEAFVKKFTRKPKKEKPPEEIVLVPEEYPSLFANSEEAYRQYFLYWKSWQDELINALLGRASHKKQLSCIDEATKNLGQMRNLLVEDKQKELDIYLSKLADLRNNISEDVYSNNATKNRSDAEQLKRNILKDFSYSKIKNSLK